MNMRLRDVCAIAPAIPLCAKASGPLDPGGPPAAIMKSLDQVRPGTPITTIPCIIATPGYYYITGHLTCYSASQGIYVTATNVTIDLCGFTLDKSPPGSASGTRTTCWRRTSRGRTRPPITTSPPAINTARFSTSRAQISAPTTRGQISRCRDCSGALVMRRSLCASQTRSYISCPAPTL